jgi:hypothetical protein
MIPWVSGIAPGQKKPTGGEDRRSQLTWHRLFLTRQASVLIFFSQFLTHALSRQQLIHLFFVYIYVYVKDRLHIVFYLFTYACLLMHASYTKKKLKQINY